MKAHLSTEGEKYQGAVQKKSTFQENLQTFNKI